MFPCKSRFLRVRSGILGIFAYSFLFFSPLALTSRGHADERVFHIGVIIGLTGDGAAVGEAFRNGLNLAIEKLPAGQRKRLRLHYEDDAMQAKNAVTAWQRLTSQYPIDLVLSIATPPGRVLVPLAERANIPIVSVSSDSSFVIGKQYALNFWVPLDSLAQVAATEVKSRGYRKIARISTSHEGRLAVKKVFDRFNGNRIEIPIDEEAVPTERDFRSFIARIRTQKDIDAIFVNLFLGQIGQFAKQAREAGMKLPFFGFELLEDEGEVRAAKGAPCGAWYVNGNKPSAVFIKEYTSRFPGASMFSAGNAFDLLTLIGQATETAQTKEDLLRALKAVKNYSGVLGTYSALKSNAFSMPPAVLQVSEGCRAPSELP